MLEIIIFILSVILNTVLGLAVLINNPKKDVNRLFFYLTLSLSLWVTITYFSLHPIGLAQITWVRLVLASAALQDYFVLTSFAVFPNGSFKSLKFAKPAAYYLLLVMLLTQTPFVFKSLNEHSQPIPAPGILLFMILILGYLGGAVYLLIKRFHKSSGQIKNQLRVVIFGVVTCFAAIVFTNFVLVSVFKNTSLISFAPLLTLILTGSMAYAILKHHLFDIRRAVARGVAYLLALTLLVIFYSGLAFTVDNLFSQSGNGLTSSQRFFYISLAVVSALAFQSLKRFFDKITNKVFFKDAYEPQLLLDNLSNILVANIRLEPLLKQASGLIADYMKLVNCNFIVRSSDKKNFITVGTSYESHQEIDSSLVEQITTRHEQIMITDDLPYSHQDFKDALSSLNCAAIIKLSTHKTKVGYLLVGSKRSGDVLNSLDVRVLGIIADELAIAIENSLRFEQISQFNITLQAKIEAATRQIRQANVRLKELDATKDEFISMASHQLRTPLTTIKGYLSMILDGDVGKVKAEEKDLVQHAFDSAQRMVYLIADLLNVSRLQSGKFIIDNKPTHLPEVVEGEVQQLKEQASNRKIIMHYTSPKEFPTLNLDETKVRQVIMNFLDNALYYTPANGEVTVELLATADSASFTVTDTGVGVPKDIQHHLFTKFYRADNARKMRPDGTGLGLYMAKKVIVAQGGAIIFKSTEGKGSTFGFSFPLSTTKTKE